jgi:hypothetical protein
MNEQLHSQGKRGKSIPNLFLRLPVVIVRGKNLPDDKDTEKEVIEQIEDDALLKSVRTSNELVKAIRKEAGEEVLNFISLHIPLHHQEVVLYTSKQESLYQQVDYNNIQAIINLRHVNKHRDINSLFGSINKLLPDAGLYVGCVETYHIRKLKLFARFGKIVGQLFWILDLLINRVIPKINYLRPLYFFLTQNKYHVISLAETLGRLVYCGYEIIEYKKINNFVYFVVRKVREPRNDTQVSYGPLFAMKRVGKNGKIINVYKFRTMHPYSEYLQDYVLKRFGYNEAGKPANDFRLTGWGKMFRKLWLDEIPQIINVLKGELAIVGVRPLSQVRYNQLPEDVKSERIRCKPGCIPPYVSLCMPDATGNITAERIYLQERKQHPWLTNFKYFMMAVYNIVTNKIRSA